jgi:hypothetical protein
MKAVFLALADFLRAGLRPRTPLATAIVLALAVKLVAIATIWLVWFSGDARPPADAATIAHLTGPTAPPP